MYSINIPSEKEKEKKDNERDTQKRQRIFTKVTPSIQKRKRKTQLIDSQRQSKQRE